MSFAGFFPDNAAGLDGFAGRFGELVLAGTVLEALRSGFLCVISDLSTFRKPLVTSSPRLSSAKTAPMPPPDVGDEVDGGGGGGGGAPGAGGADEADGLKLLTETPYITVSRALLFAALQERIKRTLGFHTKPVVWNSMIYFRCSSSKEIHARTHSVCLGSLKK